MNTNNVLDLVKQLEVSASADGFRHASLSGEIVAQMLLGHSLTEVLTTIVKTMDADDVTISVNEPSPIDGKRSFSVRAYRHRRS